MVFNHIETKDTQNEIQKHKCKTTKKQRKTLSFNICTTDSLLIF